MTRLRPIVTEPLELEMIAAVLNGFSESGLSYRIFDPWLEGGSAKRIIERESPDVLILSGYVTAVDEIIDLANYAKAGKENLAVWVGGVHAEGCPEDFFVPSVDAVFYANPLWGLTSLLKERLEHGMDFETLYETTPGLACKKLRGEWGRMEPSAEIKVFEMPRPDRRYFEAHRHKIRYVAQQEVALLKTALSCPHQCEFCYCRLLNGGEYRERPMEDVIKELRGINADTIWIVDDCFLTTAERAEAWIEALEGLAAEGVRKRFIAYARADSVVRLQKYVQRLKALGFEEWIVGLEAVADAQLRQLGKGLEVEDNAGAVSVIRAAGARLTALFLVSPDDGPEDFRRLAAWIKSHGVRRYTVSILTPLKGTTVYGQYAERMKDPRLARPARFDFLHLVMRPTRMPAWLFYLRFWRLSMGARLK
jgi:radical SAM superfamily enzyme YgiQ (UPF0313 family)